MNVEEKVVLATIGIDDSVKSSRRAAADEGIGVGPFDTREQDSVIGSNCADCVDGLL